MHEIVDIHPHIISQDAARYPSKPLRDKQSAWSAVRPQTFEDLIREMDEAGIAKAAIVQASTYYGFDNSYVADSVAKNPTRFTGVCTIDVLAPDAVTVLQGWLDRGMSGLRLFTGGATHAADAGWLTDPKTFPVWDHAAQKNIPICVQTGPDGLGKVRELLERFPNNRVILDHIGRPKLDDGPPYNDAKSLFDLAVFDNLYLKLTPRSFTLAESGASTPEAFFPALVAAFGSDHIAYGSNLPANEGPMTMLIDQARLGLASLPDADQAAILSGTAKTLYPVLA